MTQPNGYILYEGPSALDGKPIVMIATGFRSKSQNPKTGDMIQTYIIRSDISPTQAIKTREDASICGNCKHRGFFGAGRTCYVQVHQAPSAVYNAYKRGSYTTIGLTGPTPAVANLLANRSIRIGSYGDPAALPNSLAVLPIIYAKNHTCYTHEWRTSSLRAISMASVDTEVEAKEAQKLGWRTFRVKNEKDPILDNEVECPAIAKPGIITCQTCKLCCGVSNAKNVVLNVHGAKWKIDNFKEIVVQ